MGFRPEFTNPMGSLGEGVARAADTVARFFSQRAQQQYTEGVGHIEEAQNQVQQIDELMARPDFEARPEEQAALNEIRSYWEAVRNMRPPDARRFVQENPPPSGVTVRDIERTRPARETRSTRQGAPGVGQPAQRERVREVARAPEGQFRGRLERETEGRRIRRERGYTLEDFELQRAHDLQVRGDQREFEEYMEGIRHKYGLERAEVDAELQDWLDAQGTERGVEATLTVAERNEAWNSLRTAIEGHREADPVSTAQLEDMAANEGLPEPIRRQAQAALQADISDVIAARESALETQLAEDRAAIAEAEAREETVPQELRLGVQRSQQELDLLGQQFRIGEQQLDLTSIQMDGQELANERAEFELEADRMDNAAEYIERAIGLGMPERIMQLIEESENPGAHPHLSHLVEQTTRRELDQALELAQDSYRLADRERKVALAELDQAFNTLERADALERAEFVNQMGRALGAEEIASHPEIQRLVEAGLLSENDVRSMVGRAEFRESMEKNEVNGPRIESLNTRLDEYAQPDNFPDPNDPAAMQTAEAGLRATLHELVRLDMMDPSEIDGLVEVFKAGWANRHEAFRMDMALNQARINQLRSQAALQNAKANAPEGMGIDPQMYNAYVTSLNRRLDGIAQEADQAGCTIRDEVGRQMIKGSEECGVYRLETREVNNQLHQATQIMAGQTFGFDPDGYLNDDDLMQEVRTRLEVLQQSITQGNATPGEEMQFDTLVQMLGGEEETAQFMGWELVPDEEPAEEGDGEPGVFRQGVDGLFNAVVSPFRNTFGGADEPPPAPMGPDEQRADWAQQQPMQAVRNAYGSGADAIVKAVQDLRRARELANNPFSSANRRELGQIAERFGMPERDQYTNMSPTRVLSELEGLLGVVEEAYEEETGE